MKRFVFQAIECTGEDPEIWEDVGFKLTEPGGGTEQPEQPDVVFWIWAQETGLSNWQKVRQLLPKLFVVSSECEQEITVPENFSGTYERQTIIAGNICFTIGSRLQGKVAVPCWEAYGSGGPLSRAEQTRALAASVYRFLLEDMFRETAEWCGHMSSVVGLA